LENLISIVKQFTGNVVCLGVQDGRILRNLEQNKQVNVYTIERSRGKSIFSRKKKAHVKESKSKKVNMKKLRKTFKKKSVDYIVCDINEIYDYFKYFIYDSVVINKKKLYLYGESKYIDPKVLSKRFKRYHAKVTIIESSSTQFLLVVDNAESRGNWFQSKWYIVIDTFHNIGDMISAALIS